MITKPFKYIALPLAAAALFFLACGKSNEAPEDTTAAEEVKIPEAPDAAIQFVLDELAKANGTVLWQAMPASYQADVNSIAQLAGTKIDPEIYDKVFATVNRIAAVLNEQKEFFFNSELAGEDKDEEALAQMRNAWPSVMDLVDTLTTSSLASAAGLQNFEGKAFFQDTVSAVLADMDALAKLQPEDEQVFLSDLNKTEIKLLESSATEASLEMTFPGEETEIKSFVQLEERWVPLEMAQTWEKQTAETRSTLEAIDPAKLAKQKPQIMTIFGMFDSVLAQIEAAETQEQFDQALQGAMMPVMGLMMMVQGMGGETPGMPEGDSSVPEIPQGMPNMPSTPNPSAPDSLKGF